MYPCTRHFLTPAPLCTYVCACELDLHIGAIERKKESKKGAAGSFFDVQPTYLPNLLYTFI